VRFWDLATGAGKVFATYTDESWTLAFSPDGKLLASGSKDKTVHLFDLATGQERKLIGHTSGIGQVEFTKDSRRVVSRGERERVRIWDVATGSSEALTDVSNASGFYLTSDGKTLVFSDKEALVLYDLASRARKTLKLPGLNVRWVAFSDDKKHAAVTLVGDKSPRLIDVATGKVSALAAHAASAQTVTFLPGIPGAFISTDGLGEVRLWNVADKSYRKLGSHDGIVYRVTPSPDGKTLATAGGDGSLGARGA
jgi:WD40 repeat protein